MYEKFVVCIIMNTRMLVNIAGKINDVVSSVVLKNVAIHYVLENCKLSLSANSIPKRFMCLSLKMDKKLIYSSSAFVCMQRLRKHNFTGIVFILKRVMLIPKIRHMKCRQRKSES